VKPPCSNLAEALCFGQFLLRRAVSVQIRV
jgi:hypothetical protein